MKHALVTGGTGFIGSHLIELLSRRGLEVTCLVRKDSNTDRISNFQPQLIQAEFADTEQMNQPDVVDAFRRADVVFHLGGTTKSLERSTFQRVNVNGTENVLKACRDCPDPPVVIHVSSLAAAGPAIKNQPRTEQDTPQPVSNYGRSKLDSEAIVRQYSSELPVTIVRPPIVVGPIDRDGFEIFKTIANLGIHLIPGFQDGPYSIIDARDLSNALFQAASNGQRVSQDSPDRGIYFAECDQRPTYKELGQLVCDALGQKRVWMIRCPLAAIWCLAAGNEGLSRLRGKPHIFNLDKAREASAGSWACDGSQLKRDTEFKVEHSLSERLSQTARWYRDNGWLK